MKRALALQLLGLALAALAPVPGRAADRAPPSSWGAIASVQGGWGYAFNQASRAAAEQAAREQCERAAGRRGGCAVRISFDRACGALATGNFGEWGAASAATLAGARQAATAQCDGHLPTEPCKVAASVCSLPETRAR
jgi:hypothetical protein